VAICAPSDEMRASNQFLSAFSISFGAITDFRLEKILWRMLAYNAVEGFGPIPRWLLLGPEQRRLSLWKGDLTFKEV